MGSLKQALELAERQALDTVLLCEEPPVIKICNVASHLSHSTLPSQREVPVTTISYRVTENDLEIKLRSICGCREKQDVAELDVSFRAKDKSSRLLSEEVRRA
jgi:translation initiation factor IF-3